MLGARDPAEARDATVALNKRMSDLVGVALLFYPADIVLARSNVTGPLGHGRYPATSWNIFEWAIFELRGSSRPQKPGL